ncbi:MAG: hypothetical protein IJT59_07485 [Desulfovibrionaceae bacterium]|nr:hypothetical protein [Desulfovibrionaceae bacterium]
MGAEESWAQFLDWLTERHTKIKEAEDTAKSFLQKGDQEGYKEHLINRAKLLERMPLDARAVIDPLPEDLKMPVERALQRFASSASMGLKLGSTFYLSALLYRDDHGVDEPDNLAYLLDEMRKAGLNFRG